MLVPLTVGDSLNSASFLASLSSSLKGDSGAFGEKGCVCLSSRSVDGSVGLLKVAMTRRKIIFCPTTRRIWEKSCSVMLARMASEVTWCSASTLTRAAGISCLEQNFSSQGEQTPAWSAFFQERLGLGGMVNLEESKA